MNRRVEKDRRESRDTVLPAWKSVSGDVFGLRRRLMARGWRGVRCRLSGLCRLPRSRASGQPSKVISIMAQIGAREMMISILLGSFSPMVASAQSASRPRPRNQDPGCERLGRSLRRSALGRVDGLLADVFGPEPRGPDQAVRGRDPDRHAAPRSRSSRYASRGLSANRFENGRAFR